MGVDGEGEGEGERALRTAGRNVRYNPQQLLLLHLPTHESIHLRTPPPPNSQNTKPNHSQSHYRNPPILRPSNNSRSTPASTPQIRATIAELIGASFYSVYMCRSGEGFCLPPMPPTLVLTNARLSARVDGDTRGVFLSRGGPRNDILLAGPAMGKVNSEV